MTVTTNEQVRGDQRCVLVRKEGGIGGEERGGIRHLYEAHFSQIRCFEKKKNQRANGRTHPLIEMRGRL